MIAFRAVFVVVAIAGCAGQQGDEATVPPQPTETIEGLVRVAGTAEANWVALVTADTSLRVVGPLEIDIRTLEGARLRAVGAGHEGTGGGHGFHVTDYDVLEIDGQVPVVGTLLRVDSDFWIAEPDSVGGERLQLIGVPSSIGETTGGKIWVVGIRGSSQIRVQSYGVIRRPPGS